ncbi:hypothetical protein [Cellulosilyticum sp. I15G10I2]|uniref:hypothetical protein n=1 Tax=Cellulosilyticum sp. I15G10I2 TaxID=1892843 RepID=UPI0009F62368|nr:hypothetical protein [Cellulosilyticum sp. I15G10I2]
MKRKVMMICIYSLITIFTATLGLVLLSPISRWHDLPTTSLNVWIVDKTVPIPDYREHKGLMWVLNHNKVIYSKTESYFQYDKDYFGFFPVSKDVYDIREIPEGKENPDLIYLTDTYGVYTDDYLMPNVKGVRSDLIYGGLTSKELLAIKKNIGQANTLIGEFNIASAPTNAENRKELSLLFGTEWMGWKGRYFKELSRDIEVPVWVVDNYEKQYQKQWHFKGDGYVLVSDSDEIAILEGKTHVGKTGLTIKFEDPYTLEFDIKEAIPYHYWFEFANRNEDSETLANYALDLTEEGKEIMEKLQLPLTFPAVIRKINTEYTSYYFAGDYADLQEVHSIWKYYGFDKVKKMTTSLNKGAPDYFYWNCYVPMMNKIISDVKTRENQDSKLETEGLSYIAKTQGKDFYIHTNGTWEKKFLKGVNIGAAKPGAFPGELAITKDEYLRWFKYISEMNAEVIRVYTTLKPDFYDALYLYNKTAKKPLYLIQGVWVKEEDIETLKDAYADHEKIKNEFIKDASDLADIIHGNAILPERKGFASGTYNSDISQYVIGWILGIEWDPEFVENTNNNHADKKSYEGEYLFTEGASPFEVFLCEVGDKVLAYEAKKYNMVRPLSYANWPTTDMLKHPNEPLENEDRAEVNIEHIKPHKSLKTGVFASYHIYPYYPDFMNYQREYVSFKDDSGKVNTYKAYLRDLMRQHTIPVMVAEFGVPASRGMAHINIHMGYNQGKLDEAEQGRIVGKLLQDIYDEGYCGGLVFAWQDEWFKRTWNTMDLDLPDSRPYWSNPQTNEQQFGLLAFEPGAEESICYVDGDIDEWQNEKPVYEDDGIKLFAKSDEKYMYLMADTKDFDFDKDKIVIPIDTIGGQGNEVDKLNNLKFTRAVDFILMIDGMENSRIQVDAYYDSFHYMYPKQFELEIPDIPFGNKGSGIFIPQYLCLSRGFVLPQDGTIVPFSKYETGLLTYGNAHPKKENYNSLSDYYVKEGKVEIRIPWQLLNVMDPSKKSIIGDLYKNKGIEAEQTKGFYFGAAIIRQNEPVDKIEMSFYSWEPWDEPTFHERLKPSYYSLKDTFEKIK